MRNYNGVVGGGQGRGKKAHLARNTRTSHLFFVFVFAPSVGRELFCREGKVFLVVSARWHRIVLHDATLYMYIYTYTHTPCLSALCTLFVATNLWYGDAVVGGGGGGWIWLMLVAHARQLIADIIL